MICNIETQHFIENGCFWKWEKEHLELFHHLHHLFENWEQLLGKKKIFVGTFFKYVSNSKSLIFKNN